MRCNRCQFDNAPNASACAKCGAPLRAQAGEDNTQVITRAQLRRAQEAARASAPAAQPAAQPRRAAPKPSRVEAPAQGEARPAPAGAQAASSQQPAPRRAARASQSASAQAGAPQDAPPQVDKTQALPPQATQVIPPLASARQSAPQLPRPDEYARRRPEPPSAAEEEADEAIFHDRPLHPQKNTPIIAGICVLSGLALVLLVICFVTFTSVGQRWKATIGLNAPAEIYWQLGDEALASGDTQRAADYFNSAFSRDSSNYDGALKLAEALTSVGNTERAERAYRKAISLDPTRTEAYDSVIELMTARGASDSEMVDMLKLAYQNTANADYNSLLLTYGPSSVRFDPDEGTYEYAVKLQMACDDGATIYYTTDGSQPTIYSNKYVLPIELGEGVFTVRAIAYRNDLYSGETHKTYTITFPTVPAPQFNSKPGKYAAGENGRKVINVTVPDDCTVYYTTDGSAPTVDSHEYDDGISLEPGSYTLRMIAVNSDGQTSSETSAEYQIIGELKAAFNDEDSFLSFRVDVTTQDDVNEQFKKLLETTGDTSTFFTQHYNFGEVDFTVKSGVPLVTAVRITNSDITGVRGTKVGWSAQDVLDEFRNEQNEAFNGEQVLYTLEGDQYGWIEYNSAGVMTSINYMYVRNGSQLVELHYAIENSEVAAMEYCISDM